MSGRCEPPVELREREGWHFIEGTAGFVFPSLWKKYAPWDDYRWFNQGRCVAADSETALDWRYLHPVSPHNPADVARLVEAARAVSLNMIYAAEGIRAIFGAEAATDTHKSQVALDEALAAFGEPGA